MLFTAKSNPMRYNSISIELANLISTKRGLHDKTFHNLSFTVIQHETFIIKTELFMH